MASIQTLPNLYEAEILNGIYNYVPIIVIRITKDGNILEVQGTNRYLQAYGFELQNQNFYKLFVNMCDDLYPVFEFNRHTKFKSKFENKNQIFHWDNFAFPISDTENGEKQAIIISIDITDDVRSREDLNEKNNELKAIFDAIPDLYFRLDTKGLILDYKSAISSNMYVPSEAFLNSKIETFLPANLNKKITKCISEVNSKKKLVTMEYQLELSNVIRYFEARFFPLPNDQITLIIREITDKVEIQDKILENEKMLLETQKIAKVYSYFWDLQNDVFTFTDEFYTIAEINEDEIINQRETLINLVHPEDRNRVKEEIKIALEKSVSIKLEFRFLMKDKRIKYIQSEGKIKRNSKGEPIQMLGLNQDITLRKQNELELITQKSELQRLLNNIEGIVASQTNELRLEKEKAVKANQAKSYFLANVSHELKTPIHAIMSFAELGKERLNKNETNKIREYFEFILESVERLYKLMTNILDLSKLESGNETFQFTNSSLCSVCKEVVGEMKAIFDQKGIILDFKVPNFSTELYFDKIKIAQVIRNILANSIRFSESNSRIELEFVKGNFHRSNMDAFDGIGFIVRDFGEGILQDEAELIFEMFRQGRKVKLGTGGTGLGLSISREIVNNHKGIIFAKNHIQGGAEFYIILPIEPKSISDSKLEPTYENILND